MGGFKGFSTSRGISFGKGFGGGGRSSGGSRRKSGGGYYSGSSYRGSSYGGSYSGSSSYSYSTESWNALQANINKKLASDNAKQQKLKAETLQVYNDAEAAHLNMADGYKRRDANADAASGWLKGVVDPWGRKG